MSANKKNSTDSNGRKSFISEMTFNCALMNEYETFRKIGILFINLLLIIGGKGIGNLKGEKVTYID